MDSRPRTVLVLGVCLQGNIRWPGHDAHWLLESGRRHDATIVQASSFRKNIVLLGHCVPHDNPELRPLAKQSCLVTRKIYLRSINALTMA